ncbi:NADP-dependent oxidoreductase domain-containing protein [Xylariaceae sp. FL0804]|nr:NADP-dependent oxidoreductase domain-containing protein [Xylariaceae sp. FL0804]
MGYQILGKEAGNIGFGLMSFGFPRPETEDEKIAAMKAALDAGATSWNGGEFYGPSLQEGSPALLKKYFEKYPEDAAKISLNIKGGLHLPMGLNSVDNSPAYTRESIENCLALLGPVKQPLDMWEIARRVTQDDYIESLKVIDGYVKAGKIGGVALTEVNAATVRQAAKLVKVAAVEVEISLFFTEPLTDGVCAACKELDIPIFAYSPLGRGFLTGKFKSVADLPKQYSMSPRFWPENFDTNLKLVEQVEKWAAAKNCTPAQFAINWVAALSRRPGMPKIIPIPGAGNLQRVKENIHEVPLTDADMDEVSAFLTKFIPSGDRWPEAFKVWEDKTT